MRNVLSKLEEHPRLSAVLSLLVVAAAVSATVWAWGVAIAALILSLAALLLGYVANRNRKCENDELWSKLERRTGHESQLWRAIGRIESEQPDESRPVRATQHVQGRTATPMAVTPAFGSVSRDDWEKLVDWVRENVKQLKGGQDSLQREVEAILRRVNEGSGASPPVQPKAHHTLGPEEQGLVVAYNAATVGDRSGFMGQYHVERVGAANANDLARDPDVEPHFEVSESGDYFAIRLDGLRSGEVFVVPRLGLVYGEELHQRAGMKRVFESEGYDPRLRYRSIRLVAPAIFRSGGGPSYKLVRSGALVLEEGEQAG